MRRLLLVCLAVVPALHAQGAPLQPYAGTKVAVTPVQFVRVDSGWGAPAGPVLRAAFDSLLSVALDEHGLGAMWATPAKVIRTAKRNASYVSDPRNLGAFSVRNGARTGTRKDQPIADPLASNLRAIVALTDARYALVPVEITAQNGKDGGRLIVRLLLVDARLSAPLWEADLQGESAAAFAPTLIEKLANRVAELVVAP